MTWYTQFDTVIPENLPDLHWERDVPMAEHTSFKVGGNAGRMAYPVTVEQLVLLVHLATDCGARPMVIGKGSNLLVGDGGLDRLVIDTTAALTGVTVLEGNRLQVQAGATMARMADVAQKQGLTGVEFAHGIPGSLGGGIVMNAGAYGGELCQVVASVTVLDPERGVVTLPCEDMDFGYRHSILQDHPDWVVLEAVLQLQVGDKAAIRSRMVELIGKRKDKQPLEYPNAGSTFKRPEGHFAGALIEQCGLKGFTIGGAQVSEKHAGFVINRGGATCSDVLALMKAVEEKVLVETGVQLEAEVRILCE
ncbi:UDP-N-acetylmuramate dehydrogenase [Bengtsoniella intestinalis]|uniref:UDP-N-acetylmuramate dehydrogenase n=1 Tax=Bengtsoniella intestinalis TaxID=3073143 RepID=UPI00391FBBE3